MNLYLQALMSAPSPGSSGRCAVCCEYPTERHHIVRRSQGGADGPLIELCRDCHHDAHQMRLHFRYTDRWEYLATVPMKYERALEVQGWREV
ncbi:MAG: HNH endonuclease signature motif containing protein [Desulfomicrobium apsheronum]|nr:HNH endonuclease signature motif containing protein [Desulfomicrobium apsheronum]